MTWTIVYSPFILKQFLPSEHYALWCLFSLSCSLFCRPFLHHTELVKADQLIMDFCVKFKQILGEEFVTTNIQISFKGIMCYYGNLAQYNWEYC